MTTPYPHGQRACPQCAAEIARLREALQFYADREHLSGEPWDEWEDGLDSEAMNWLCPPNDDGMMVENGGIARAALAKEG